MPSIDVTVNECRSHEVPRRIRFSDYGQDGKIFVCISQGDRQEPIIVDGKELLTAIQAVMLVMENEKE